MKTMVGGTAQNLTVLNGKRTGAWKEKQQTAPFRGRGIAVGIVGVVEGRDGRVGKAGREGAGLCKRSVPK